MSKVSASAFPKMRIVRLVPVYRIIFLIEETFTLGPKSNAWVFLLSFQYGFLFLKATSSYGKSTFKEDKESLSGNRKWVLSYTFGLGMITLIFLGCFN